MAHTTNTTLTKTDLAKIEASIQKVMEVAQIQKSNNNVEMALIRITKELQNLKTLVELDHERRLQAIEDYLQNL